MFHLLEKRPPLPGFFLGFRMKEGDCGNSGSDQNWPSVGFQARPSESQSSVATMEGGDGTQ